ncbi:MAG TPA: ribosome small subunit-dependent GTPase A [Bacillales bacterium]|nr:ribosome small subunit-dependent GTPase A [Bacillales bacterium]
MNLKPLGWQDDFEEAFEPYKADGYMPGRIALEHKGMYRVFTEHGDLLAEVTGSLRFRAETREDFPAVGDWVVLEPRPGEERASIHAVLPRQSKFSRKAAGTDTSEQLIATNIDTVFLLNALNHDFNVRRMERYLTITWESGANPVIILSKADLCSNIDEKIADVEAVAFGVPIHVISAANNEGLDELAPYFEKNETVALLGSSGVGKSTLINRLYGEDIQNVKEAREDDDRGRHTTTHRELILLPDGGILIDTPGMRELQLWESGDSLSHSFGDIEELAGNCKFRDCQHKSEPGCAIQEALEDGTLDQDRFNNYLKLQRELAFLERKTNKRLQREERNKWKKIAGDRTRVHRQR